MNADLFFKNVVLIKENNDARFTPPKFKEIIE
jgi:hypothetical protein